MKINTMKTLLQMTMPDLQNFLKIFLTNHYEEKNILITEKYIIARGNIPVGLVAHMDTVFQSPPENIFIDKDSWVMWSPEGCGFDDRAGIYAIIQIIQKGFKPTVIFTTDEEIGGLGANAVVSDIPKLFWNLKFLIELDRSGSQDSVYYSCDNKDFEKYINSFGFKTDIGSFTDISILMPNWKIAGVNLSIGYYMEHTNAEHLYIKDMEKTISKVINILQDVKNNKDKIPKYKYIKRENNYWNFGRLNECIFCNKTLKDDKNYHYITPDNITIYKSCDKCFREYYSYNNESPQED